MRALVTGAGGFVGRHLVEHLAQAGDHIVGWSGPEGSAGPDVLDRDSLAAALGGLDFDVVYHLAAQSRVDASWRDPATTLATNAGGTANLIDALARVESKARIVLMSSAEVYGLVTAIPVTEQAPLAPRSPYGVSKVAAEQVALLLGAERGIDVVICRPFNQIGPGQAPTFVTAAFAKQIATNELHGIGEIRVGNLSATRDFLDVRDAVVAYRALAADGTPGRAYNVTAGHEVAIEELLQGLIAHSSADQQIVVDQDRFRPNDLDRMYGSGDALAAATGWGPTRTLDQTLADVLADWRDRVVA